MPSFTNFLSNFDVYVSRSGNILSSNLTIVCAAFYFSAFGCCFAVKDKIAKISSALWGIATAINALGVCDALDVALTAKYASGKGSASKDEIYAANGQVADAIDVEDYQLMVNKALA